MSDCDCRDGKAKPMTRYKVEVEIAVINLDAPRTMKGGVQISRAETIIESDGQPTPKQLADAMRSLVRSGTGAG